MKYLIWMLLICPSISFGQNYIDQKYDNKRYILDILTSGCNNSDPNDTMIKVGSIFDFSKGFLETTFVDTHAIINNKPIKYYTHSNVSQICNEKGAFLAYFNGGELWDRQGDKIILDIFYNPIWMEYSAIYGYSNSVILPYPGEEKTYILVNTNDFQVSPPKTVPWPEDFSAVIFTEREDGKLIIQNSIEKIHKDKYTFDGAITACRHANGRDWWLVCPRRDSKVFNFFLLDPAGVRFHHQQEMPSEILGFTYAPVFSPDGLWYTRTAVEIKNQKYIDHGQIYKFDRCEGMFLEQNILDFPPEDTSSISHIIFDKTSKFYYIMRGSTIWQGEIDKAISINNLVKIGEFNPNIPGHNSWSVIGPSFLGPDNKIYTFDGRNSYYSSIIHNPSEDGTACNFKYNELLKPSCTGMSLGNMPDFNLGPLDGSSCDTLGLDNPMSVIKQPGRIDIHLYPNPTDGQIRADLPPGYEEMKICILNFAGHLSAKYTGRDLMEGIDLSHLKKGIYYVQMEGLGVKKVIKM